MPPRIGFHVPVADPLAEAELREATAVQVFLSNPRSWKAPVVRADAAALRASEVPLYAHAPYIINVATTNPRVRHPSRKNLEQTVRAAEAVGAAGVVVHGGHLPESDDVAQGFANWRATLERLETEVPILIENTAGGANAVARHVDRIAQLWEALDGVATPFGLVLDTCHAHAGGEPLDGLVDRVLAAVGEIALVHVNDSKDAAGSGRDRHARIGRGTIGLDVVADLVRAAGVDVILETPGTAAEQLEDVRLLRSHLAAPSAGSAA
jgi:deoxyribonuclease IV